MLYKKRCINCNKDFDIDANNYKAYGLLFCSVKCQETYYENKVLKKAKEMGIDVPIENRWQILDL